MDDFGTPLLATRDKAGQFHAFLNACRHRSVRVASEDKGKRSVFMCPFHHWEFDSSGQCVKIPYAKPQKNACLNHWPVVERNGQVLTFYSAHGDEPYCDVPEDPLLTGGSSSGWGRSHFKAWQYEGYIYDVVENVVDLGHFGPVHNAETLPEVKALEFDGPFARMHYTTQTTVLNKTHIANLRLQYYGPAYTVLHIGTITDIALVASVTPIDEKRIQHRFHFRMKKKNRFLDPIFLALVARRFQKDFVGDINIWQHKIYQKHPVLCQGEGNSMKIRRWLEQFDEGLGYPT